LADEDERIDDSLAPTFSMSLRKTPQGVECFELIRSKAMPFFFVYCRMRLLILGQSVGKGKEKTKTKLEKESGARRPGTSA